MECKLENISVHYESFGQGRPLILLPGWTMSAHSYANFMEPFLQARTDWQRIYIDPPGHGRTPSAPTITNLDQILGVLLDCVNVLVGERPFALAGMSLGAYLSRGILQQRFADVCGLAMLVPVIVCADSGRSVPEFNVLIEDAQAMADLNDNERMIMEHLVIRSQAMVDEIRGWAQPTADGQSDYAFLQGIREDPVRYTCSFDIDALDQPFQHPTLIITARQDASVGYEDALALLENFPRASFVIFDRAGHLLEEKEPLIGPLLNEWLDRVEESLAN